jgi:osmotically inducible lipoprotein OsmB
MMTKVMSRMALAGMATAGVLMLGGCNNAGEGLLAGGGIGAGAGAILGSLSGHAGTGAAIGAVAGGIGGAIIGDQNQRNAYGPPPGYGYPQYATPVYVEPAPRYYYAYPPPPRRVYVYDRGW